MPQLAAEEIVQIVDRDNTPTDTVPRKIMRQQGLIHRASYILVFNGANELFIQKRTMIKDIFPGFWDIAAGGVVLAGETYDESARRELFEELGVKDIPIEFLFHHYFDDGTNKVWGGVYRCRHEGPFILQKEEIESGMFIPIEDIFNNTLQGPVTPDGIEILEKLT